MSKIIIYISINWIHLLYINVFDTVVYWKVLILWSFLLWLWWLWSWLLWWSISWFCIHFNFHHFHHMSHVFRNGVVKCVTLFHCKRNYDCHKKICCGVKAYRCDTCGNVYKSKKGLCGHRRKHHTDDVCHFTFFVENVNYINFSHIWCRCGLRIFHDLHAMVLYYREQEMRVMKGQGCLVDHFLIM